MYKSRMRYISLAIERLKMKDERWKSDANNEWNRCIATNWKSSVVIMSSTNQHLRPAFYFDCDCATLVSCFESYARLLLRMPFPFPFLFLSLSLSSILYIHTFLLLFNFVFRSVFFSVLRLSRARVLFAWANNNNNNKSEWSASTNDVNNIQSISQPVHMYMYSVYFNWNR